MGIGRKRGPGGGGASLNFDVKAYPSEAELLAAVPKENTIGVITTTPITSWAFSATELEVSSEGTLLILTGTASPIEFNALKKNVIQVYPISAKQYVNGAWVEKIAKSRRGGAWVDWWNGELYDAGNQYESFTGGWFANPNTSAYVVFNADNIQFVNGENTQTAAAIYTQNKIDITRFSKLRIKGTVTNFDGNNIKFGLTNSNTTGYSPSFVASAQVSKTGSMDAELYISDVPDGGYYVAVWSKYANFKITQIMLEV